MIQYMFAYTNDGAPDGHRIQTGRYASQSWKIFAAVIALAAVIQFGGVNVEMFAGWKPDRTG